MGEYAHLTRSGTRVSKADVTSVVQRDFRFFEVERWQKMIANRLGLESTMTTKWAFHFIGQDGRCMVGRIELERQFR